MPTLLPERTVVKPETTNVSAVIAIVLGVAVLMVGMVIHLPVPYEVVTIDAGATAQAG